MTIFTRLIEFYARYSPVILLVVSTMLLMHKKILCVVFLLGYCLNEWINITLKQLIHEKRPGLTERDGYGMPSGHAQALMYSTLFIHLALRNAWITAAFIVTTIISMSQCILYQYHTINQLIVGGGIGALIAYSIFTVILNNSRRLR
jgi:membrane-associated phospholipid phosphatase